MGKTKGYWHVIKVALVFPIYAILLSFSCSILWDPDSPPSNKYTCKFDHLGVSLYLFMSSVGY